MSSTYEAGDLCVYCGNDTGWGSGRFVNRIPAMADSESSFLPAEDKASFQYVDGYACAECMERDCDKCGEPIAMDEDFDIDGGGERYHFDCLTPGQQILALAGEALMNIDWELLRDQKRHLIEIIHDYEMDEDDVEALDGILNLLDAIQDEAGGQGEPVVWLTEDD